MEQSTAHHRADTTVLESPFRRGGASEWQSDLEDLSDLPLSKVDDLAPLGSDARLLTEVLRARSSMTGGSEGSARAE
ncbi:hypothetical protein SUDANB108_05453 [Streptomyces sp. enrichment culture]|uniref:hypothetical protein n=1 Tax=Streptomyces sp. enrichment culture TaxID=1795815 RepID=UPI003F54F4EA